MLARVVGSLLMLRASCKSLIVLANSQQLLQIRGVFQLNLRVHCIGYALLQPVSSHGFCHHHTS